MSEFGQNLKNYVMKGIEAIGNSAGSLAASTRKKIDEYNLSNQMNDVFCSIGKTVYELSKDGTDFPEKLRDDLEKAAQLEDSLKELRKEIESEEKENPDTIDKDESRHSAEGNERENINNEISAAEYAAENDSDIPVLEIQEDPEPDQRSESPLSNAINELFEKTPTVDKMVDKVNSSLDDLGESLRRFSGDFEKQLNGFSDQMMGKDNKE